MTKGAPSFCQMKSSKKKRKDAERPQTGRGASSRPPVASQKQSASIWLSQSAGQDTDIFRSIVETAQEGIWKINAQSLTDYVNPKMAEMMGYRPEEMLGRPIDDFLDAEGRVELVRLIKRRKSGVAEQFEFKYVRKDGSKLWAFVSTNPLTNAKGEYVGAVALLTDIEARKRTEEALRAANQRLRMHIEQTPMGVIEWDLDFRVTQWNPAASRIFGYSAKEAIGLHVLFFAPASAKPSVEKVCKALMKQRGRRSINENMRKDGRIILCEWYNTPFTDESGKLTGVASLVLDVTERKQAEEKLALERDFNKALVAFTSALIVVMDSEARVTHVNPAFVKETGYELAEIAGRPFWASGLMSTAEARRAKDRYARLLRGEDVPPVELRLRVKRGEWRVLELKPTAARHPDGSLDRIILTFTDLTERTRLQKEVLRVAEREQARIGHDLHDGVGQTLTGVTALMESLEDELKGEQRNSAARITELLHGALQEVRRMSHGLSPAGVKNRGLFGALQLLADTIRLNHRTTCVCKAADDVQIDDEAVVTHLFRIAQEAANNALRHGQPEKIILTLQKAGDDECLLKVEDDGVGLARSRRKKPQGIGLQVMEYRANLIGGSLSIESSPRGGVSVTCRFPCRRGE